MSETPLIHRGLEGIYVDTTAIANIDGEKGVLTYRGIPIEELVEREFSEVVWLIMFGNLPSVAEKKFLELIFAENSDLLPNEVLILKNIPASNHPMKVLQAMAPILNLSTLLGQTSFSIGDEALRGLVLAAKIPAILSSYYRIGIGQEILPSKAGLSFHENFLYRFKGKMPSAEEVRIFNIAQILQLEHGFNASTFAARVTASTLAPIECAVSSAIGTLYGRLHGGADQAALEMAQQIGNPKNAEDFVLTLLKENKKIMGMGHREYRVVDPRAKILKPLGKELCSGTPFMDLYLTLEKVEEVMEREMLKKGKKIKANVEFYKGPVFFALGIPPEYFTGLFAMSRVFGYLAHILESRIDNRLIRPKALYRSSPMA